jgi:hypothetical protein
MKKKESPSKPKKSRKPVERFPYNLGDIFSIPLWKESGQDRIALGWGVVLAARRTEPMAGGVGRAVDFYGFDRIYEAPPAPEAVQDLKPTDAISIITSMDHAMRYRDNGGRWQKLGPLPGFELAHWPVPPTVIEDRLCVAVREDRWGDINVCSTSYIAENERELFPYSLGLALGRSIEAVLAYAITERRRIHYVKITEQSMLVWRRVLAELLRDGVIKKSTF